jgi:hypothetical protein
MHTRDNIYIYVDPSTCALYHLTIVITINNIAFHRSVTNNAVSKLLTFMIVFW